MTPIYLLPHSPHLPPSLSPPHRKASFKTPASWRTKPINALPTRSLPVVFHIPTSVRRHNAVKAAALCPPPSPPSSSALSELCLRCHFPISGLTLVLIATLASISPLIKRVIKKKLSLGIKSKQYLCQAQPKQLISVVRPLNKRGCAHKTNPAKCTSQSPPWHGAGSGTSLAAHRQDAALGASCWEASDVILCIAGLQLRPSEEGHYGDITQH